MLNISVYPPNQVFSIKPKFVLFYDYDEVLFGRLWAVIQNTYTCLSKNLTAKLVSKDMLLENESPLTIESEGYAFLCDILESLGKLDSTYNCQGFNLWDTHNAWALSASRDLEFAILGIYDANLEPYLRELSLDYEVVLNEIVSPLVIDVDNINRQLKCNYGDQINQ